MELEDRYGWPPDAWRRMPWFELKARFAHMVAGGSKAGPDQAFEQFHQRQSAHHRRIRGAHP